LLITWKPGALLSSSAVPRGACSFICCAVNVVIAVLDSNLDAGLNAPDTTTASSASGSGARVNRIVVRSPARTSTVWLS
jgi:hypothetical protein